MLWEIHELDQTIEGTRKNGCEMAARKFLSGKHCKINPSRLVQIESNEMLTLFSMTVRIVAADSRRTCEKDGLEMCEK